MTEKADFEKALGMTDYQEMIKRPNQQGCLAWVGLYNERERAYYENALQVLGLFERLESIQRSGWGGPKFSYGKLTAEEFQNRLEYTAKMVPYYDEALNFIAVGTAAIIGAIDEFKTPMPLITVQSCAANYCRQHNLHRVGAIFAGMSLVEPGQGADFFKHGLTSSGAVELVPYPAHDVCEDLDRDLLLSAATTSLDSEKHLKQYTAYALTSFLFKYGKDTSMPRELIIANTDILWLIRNDRHIQEIIIGYHLQIIDAIALQLQAIVKELC